MICKGSRTSFLPNHTVFHILNLHIYPLTPALSQFVFLSFPLFLLFESIIFLSFAFPLFPPSSLPLPPVSIKLPFPVPLRTRGRVVYSGVAPPAIDSCDMNNTLLTKLHHSAHRPDTRCFYFCESFLNLSVSVSRICPPFVISKWRDPLRILKLSNSQTH